MDQSAVTAGRVSVPPADPVSTAGPKPAPNWALKTVMAATGVVMSAALIGGLVANLVFFAEYAYVRHIVGLRGNASWFMDFSWPDGGIVRLVGAIVAVLVVVHVCAAVVLTRRSLKARGTTPAKLHGLRSWWTKSQPVTGALAAVLMVALLVAGSRLDVTVPADGCTDASCPPGWPSLTIASALPAPVAVTLYAVGLVIAGLHMARGLTTVATIAAGNGVLLGGIKRVGVVVGGILLALLVAANIVVPIAAWRGWL